MGSFQVALLRAKAAEARFSTHAHKVPQVFIAVEGSFEITVGDTPHQISADGGNLSVTVPQHTPHQIRALSAGRLITVSLGQVVRIAPGMFSAMAHDHE